MREEIEQQKLMLERYIERLGALSDELAAKDAAAPRPNEQAAAQLNDLADALGTTGSLRILNPLRTVITRWLRRTRNVHTREHLRRIQTWISHAVEARKARRDEALHVQLGYLPPQTVQVCAQSRIETICVN